uniref:DUF1409 domain-containing protein n=1 Tax=Oryza meridionalis TaxID=40149 RepID=A0A0E0F5K7_9ORYZ
MSSSASPSATPSAEHAEHLSNLVAIPSLSHEHHYFLGPIGNPDPTDFIITETNRIPFRLTNPNLCHWKNTFKSWPSLEKTSPEKSWSIWTKRIGGWSGYVAAYMGKGSVTPREHTAFLLTIESSPPRKSNSGKDIEYAPGLIPNGGWLAPPVIGYHAPRTSSLLQGQMREPTDTGRTRKTKASAVDPSALAPRKKSKKKKTKPTDDLPALDPSIKQALDEEEIEEDVDQAAAELSDLGEKTPSASPKQTPPTPAAPAHLSRKNKVAVKKKSAAASSKPAPPVLADLFSFDIKDYFDEEAEEETTSKTLAPLNEDVKKTLEDISLRLESSLDNLVADCGSIRARFAEIQALVPDDLANAITPAVYLEQHQFKLEKAKQRMADRRERRDIEATIQANRQLVHEEKAKLDQLSVGPIQSNIDRLEARKIDLIAQLEECYD